jgi:hypothetical protein
VLDRTMLDELAPVPATLLWLATAMLVDTLAGRLDGEPTTKVVDVLSVRLPSVVVVTLDELVATSSPGLELESEFAQPPSKTATSTDIKIFIAKILPIYFARVDLRAYVHKQKCEIMVDTFACIFNAGSDFILLVFERICAADKCSANNCVANNCDRGNSATSNLG